jgi:hypothetical protein
MMKPATRSRRRSRTAVATRTPPRRRAAPTSSATTRRSGITGMETSGTDTRRCRYTRLRFATWADCWLQ